MVQGYSEVGIMALPTKIIWLQAIKSLHWAQYTISHKVLASLNATYIMEVDIVVYIIICIGVVLWMYFAWFCFRKRLLCLKVQGYESL